MPPAPIDGAAGGSRRWLFVGAVVACVAALVYALFFWPNEEDRIREVVLRLADAVEVKEPSQNPAIRALHLKGELAEVLTPEAGADIPELSEQLQGRREITAVAAGAGTAWATARISMGSMRIEIDKPRRKATARATATLTATEHGGRLRRDTRETSFELEKVDGRWWIVHIQVTPEKTSEGLP